MAICDYCEAMKKKEMMIYENELLCIMLHPKPAVHGHLLILPKEHHAIIEQVPHKIAAELWNHAKKAVKLFAQRRTAGVNILIQNGIAAGQDTPHTALQVIPRASNDKLDLSWKTKELSEDDMGIVEAKLKQEALQVYVPHEEPVEIQKDGIKQESNDHFVTFLRRVP